MPAHTAVYQKTKFLDFSAVAKVNALSLVAKAIRAIPGYNITAEQFVNLLKLCEEWSRRPGELSSQLEAVSTLNLDISMDEFFVYKHFQANPIPVQRKDESAVDAVGRSYLLELGEFEGVGVRKDRQLSTELLTSMALQINARSREAR